MAEIKIEPYSDKSFVVRGDTKAYIDAFKKLNGKYAITEDPGILASHRGVQNVIFKKASPEDKTIQIIDCSTREAKRTYSNECTGKVS